jgi:hypothetical protein
MRCAEAEPILMELIDEGLLSSRREELLGHVQVCAACAAELSACRHLLTLIQADPVPEPSPRFWEEFLSTLTRRIEREGSSRERRRTAWFASVRSWLSWPRPLVAGVAVAAISILIVVRLPGFVAVMGDRTKAPSPIGRFMGGGLEDQVPAGDLRREGATPQSAEPIVVAGELIDDPSLLAAAIQRLPWVDEIADQVEDAWVRRPESDPRDWLRWLSDEDQQLLLARLRNFRWSPS